MQSNMFCGVALMEIITLNYLGKMQNIFSEINVNTVYAQDDRRKIIKNEF